jgi:glycosyltransferase involved in cell wall biosynthesis
MRDLDSTVLVITPILNEEKNIVRCMASIAGQKGVDVIHVVGDNASDDCSVSSMAELASTHPVTLLRWDQRSSSVENWARTIREALRLFPKAGFIQMLAGDDCLLDPNHFALAQKIVSLGQIGIPDFEFPLRADAAPNQPPFGWANSNSSLVRSLTPGFRDITHWIYGLYPREAFEELFEIIVSVSTRDSAVDLRFMSIFITRGNWKFIRIKGVYFREPLQPEGWEARQSSGSSVLNGQAKKVGISQILYQGVSDLSWPVTESLAALKSRGGRASDNKREFPSLVSLFAILFTRLMRIPILLFGYLSKSKSKVI